MSDVHVRGSLHCCDAEQAREVATHLPEHVAATRAEPGCLAFTVTPTDDPLVWWVEERFDSPDAFRAHRRRAADSEWARVSRGAERRYRVEGA